MNDPTSRLADLRFSAVESAGPPASPFVCPGSNVALPRSLHLARLHAAWSGCDRCEWNSDTEGLAVRSAEDILRIQSLREDGIRRTESGVRGQYINILNRATAARLVPMFCRCFTEAANQQVSLDSRGSAEAFNARRDLQQDPGSDDHPSRAPMPVVAAGYDSRSFSPDLFVGIANAVREFGCTLIDIGHTTTAALLEAMRCFPEVSGGFIVTGAGMMPSFTGFDVFDRFGNPVPVIWKEEGIELRTLAPAAINFATDQAADLISRTAAGHALPEHRSMLHPETQAVQLILTLPNDESRRSSPRRNTRHSGAHQVVAFEDRYRDWLLKWYPRRSTATVVVRTSVPLIAERVQWLAERCGFEAICRNPSESFSLRSGMLSLFVDEDDRFFEFEDSSQPGFIPKSRLAEKINRASRTSHVSAHADDVSGRFWLTDAGRPSSPSATEQIYDALAVLGVLLRIRQE